MESRAEEGLMSVPVSVLAESVADRRTAFERPDYAPAPHPRRVLLVEDEVALRRVLARNLTSRGVAVLEAETASEAVQAVSTDLPDLLLLDINLPDQTRSAG